MYRQESPGCLSFLPVSAGKLILEKLYPSALSNASFQSASSPFLSLFSTVVKFAQARRQSTRANSSLSSAPCEESSIGMKKLQEGGFSLSLHLLAKCPIPL